MQVYLALYGLIGVEYKYLVAKKNCCARFYDHKRYKKAIPIPSDHGPNSWVFPGGSANSINHLQEAYREFEEETGIQEMMIEKDGNAISIKTKRYTVFFVKCFNLVDIFNKAYNNLGNIEIIKDDELFTVELVTSQIALSYFKESYNNSSWFIYALKKFLKRDVEKERLINYPFAFLDDL